MSFLQAWEQDRLHRLHQETLRTMPEGVESDVLVEGASLIFRGFHGKPTVTNRLCSYEPKCVQVGWCVLHEALAGWSAGLEAKPRCTMDSEQQSLHCPNNIVGLCANSRAQNEIQSVSKYSVSDNFHSGGGTCADRLQSDPSAPYNKCSKSVDCLKNKNLYLFDPNPQKNTKNIKKPSTT